jgi:hypothetical protein
VHENRQLPALDVVKGAAHGGAQVPLRGKIHRIVHDPIHNEATADAFRQSDPQGLKALVILRKLRHEERRALLQSVDRFGSFRSLRRVRPRVPCYSALQL